MTEDTMRIWNAVDKTDPKHTKTVNQRGGFTAINANYQIMRATEVFGPIGIGWGYTAGTPIFHDRLIIVPVTFWHGDRSNVFGPVYGAEEMVSDKGRLDSDAPKKATTDALTKLLSQLGFNADVFLGLYDDQKYVERVRREFEEQRGAGNMPPEVDAMIAEIKACDTVAALTIWQEQNWKRANATGHGNVLAGEWSTRKAGLDAVGALRAG